MFLGDFRLGGTIYFRFTSRDLNGAASALSSASVSIYKNGSTTPTTTGVTLSVDHDSVTGLNLVTINTATDTEFFSAEPLQLDVVLDAGTVAGQSVAGEVIARFTLGINKANVLGHTMPAATAAPAHPLTVEALFVWLAALATQKQLTTAGSTAIRNAADSATIATIAHADDGTTYTKNAPA